MEAFPHQVHFSTLPEDDKRFLFCNDDNKGNVRRTAAKTPQAKIIFKDPSPPSQPLEGCFVSSVFGLSADKVDKLTDASQWHEKYPNFEFIMYTNLVDLPTPGWRKVLYFDSRLKRMVTLSRYPKFLAWKDDWIQRYCPVVFYLDANSVIKAPVEQVRQQVANVLAAESGIAQGKHWWGLRKEFQKILTGKDIKVNMEALRAWLEAQPDFSWDSQLYVNTYFGEYDTILLLAFSFGYFEIETC